MKPLFGHGLVWRSGSIREAGFVVEFWCVDSCGLMRLGLPESRKVPTCFAFCVWVVGKGEQLQQDLIQLRASAEHTMVE